MGDDVTERQPGVARPEQARLEALQRLSHAGDWHWDVASDRVTGSDELFRICGLEPQSRVLNRAAFLSFVHPDDRQGALAGIRRAVRQREPYRFEHRLVRPDGAIRHVQGQGEVVVDDEGRVKALFGSLRDITDQRLAEAGMVSRARQQAAVARLGERSLAGAGLDEVLREAVVEIRETLGVEFAHVLDLDPEREVLVVRAAAGWPFGTVGRATVPATPGSHGALTLASTEPVIVDDLHGDDRFHAPPLLTDAGVVSGISVLIPGGDRPWGAVCAHTTRARAFTRDDANFLRSVANLLGATAARLRVEEAIRESEERFRLMVEGSEEVFFYEHDPDHRFTYLSPSLANVLGYEPDQLLGQPYDVLLREEPYADETQARTEQAIRTGQRAGTYRSAVSHRDGRRVVLEIVERPLLDDRGTVVGVQGFARDITEREYSDAALRRSEEYFRALIEDAPELIAVIDRRLRARYLSPGYTHLLGHDPARLVGSTIMELIHPDDLSKVQETMARLVRRPGATASVEARVRHGNGSWRLLQARAKNLLDLEAVAGIVVNAHDITEHRLLQNRFEQAQKMEAVGRLAGGVAHDFNNALTAITGYGRFILESLEDGHPLRSDAREILTAAEHATGVVRQLLAFSRTQVRQPVPLELNRVVGEFQKMLRHLIGAGVELAVETDPDLPVVRIDRTQVEQVLVNLALNARDAMPDGGLLRITTTRVDLDGEHQLVALEPGTYAFLSVRDTGSGMGPDVLDHLFEPFFTTKKAGRGTGLGLSTVYGIVQQNGGQIACESRAGEGTTFSIWLPAAGEGVTATTDAPVAEEQEDLTMIGKVVLVAEDEPAVRGLARRILERRGFRVLEAADGVEALEIAQLHHDRIDLLLTDAIMPRLGGRDLARRLAEQRPDVRVLFMSGYAESEIVHRGLLDPGIAFLEKPFTADELTAAVRTTLESDAQRILS